ncbi:MAG: hypothetical protein AABY22_12430 [Nanoarchaeota archaeon]
MKTNKKIKKEAKTSNQNPSADSMYSRLTSKKKAGKSQQDDGESTLRKLDLDNDETINADQQDKSDIYLRQIYDTMMSANREKKMGLDKWSQKGKKYKK